jgi:hypothetical protein
MPRRPAKAVWLESVLASITGVFADTVGLGNAWIGGMTFAASGGRVVWAEPESGDRAE